MVAYPNAYPQDALPYAPATHSPVYAGFAIRVLAYAIDSLLLAFGTSLLTHIAPGVPLLGLAFAFAYFSFLQSARGGSASLGQRVFRLRVLSPDGTALSLRRSALRAVVLGFSFWVFFLGVIWVAVDAKKRGWHDLAAGSLVVHTA